jgi:sulfatase maturation enzyme AslB (radical SAM superfamily)
LELIPFLHEIAWAGGEVFLYEDFYELFSCAKTNNVRQEIVTNAMLLDKKWLDEIMTSNAKTLQYR